MTYLDCRAHGLRLLAWVLLLLLAACGGGGPDPAPNTGASLTRIEVTPSLPSLANGTSLALTATGIYSDNSSRSLSTEVNWSSSNPSVASISPSGVLSTQAKGQITAQASLGDITGSTDITITDATLSQLEISPGSAQLANGSSLDITLMGTYSDGSTQNLDTAASWGISDPTIASISDPNTGPLQLSGLGVGATQLTANVDGTQAQIPVTVSAAELIQINISPSAPILPLGTTLTMSALGQYSDGSSQDLSTQVNWSSGDTGILTVDSTGLLTPKSLGSTSLTARMAGISANQTVTISSALLTRIEINAPTASLPLGEQQTLTALGHYSDNSLQDISQQVTWQSSPPGLLAISNASGSQGLATALATGSVTINATLGGISGSLGLTTSAAILENIDISPASAQLAAGTSTNFQATGRYSDGSIQDLSDRVSWATDNTTIATISNAAGSKGQAQGLSDSNIATTVSATLDGITGNASLTVSAAQLLSISVLPAELSLAAGTQQTLRAEGNFSDGSVQSIDDQVNWASDSSVASVANGAVSALQASSSHNQARISASLDGVSGYANITVTSATLDSLQISPGNMTLPLGSNAQLQVTALYSDGSQVDVTASAAWSSADDGLLQISNGAGQRGRLTALATGTVLVTAALDGISTSTSVTISAASLEVFRIVTSSNTLDSAEHLQLVAMGDFSDGSSRDLSADTVWSSDQPTLASVSNNTGEQGLVDAGVGVSGVAVITARYGDFSDSVNLTINNTPLRPVSLVVLATPNVIRNDDVDISSLEIRVQAADPNATVADGTGITLQISLAGSPLDTQNLVTSGGIASTTFTTTQSGLLQIQASANGTSINNSGTLFATTNTYEVIAGAGFNDAQTDGTTIFSGGRFGFFLYNLSNRDFPLLRFELHNGADSLYNTTDPNVLNGNTLSGGLQTGIIFTLGTDIPDQGIEAHYFLTDPATGNPISVTFGSP